MNAVVSRPAGRCLVAQPACSTRGGMVHSTMAPRTPAGLVGAGRERRAVKARIFGLGAPELLVIGVVAAVAFGPSKLPELGQALGKTVKSFQTAAEEFNDELKKGMESEKKEKEGGQEEKK